MQEAFVESSRIDSNFILVLTLMSDSNSDLNIFFSMPLPNYHI